MKTTLKILALLIALAIPTPSKAGYYLGSLGTDTKLIFMSDMYNANTPITEWGQAGVIWQICDWDPNGTSWEEPYWDPNYWNDETGSYGTWLTRTVYGGSVNNTLEITLNTDITINGPIYIPENKTLIIHTNGHKIIPLRTTQAEWAASVSGNTGLYTITNNSGYYVAAYNLSSFRTTSSGNLYEISGSTIYAYKYVPHCSFFVEGKLYINTGEGDTKVCEIDGGNVMTNIAYEKEKGGSPKTEIANQDVSGYKNYGGTFIYCSGDNNGNTQVKLNNLNVKNFGPSYFNNLPYASFLNVGTWWFSTSSSHATIEMNNVNITNCFDDVDAGIILSCYGNEDVTPHRYAHSTITMNNCTIDGCWAGGKNHYGGVIKGSAFGYSNFTMNDCKMMNCISPGFGGAISWAPLGEYNSQKSSLTLNKCTLTGNFARYMGGAICSEAVVNLNNCTIDGNTAGYAGGALAAMPNTIGEFTDNVGFNLVGNTISNNKTLYATNMGGSNTEDPGYYTPNGSEAENSTSFRTSYCIYGVAGTTWGDINYPSGGGGIWMFLNKENWDFSATIGEGNTITDNTSARAGGGVYVYKKAPANLPMTITLKGDITNNTAKTVGGGFAMGSNAKLPSGSEAPIIDLTGGNIKGNTAGTDGGGLYMPAGTFHMIGGNIEGNKAPNGYGGGVAMGSTTTTFDHGTPEITLSSGSIQDNVAKFRGGGVFMPAGTFTMSGGNIVGNEAGYGSTGSETDAGSGGGVGLMASYDGKLPTFQLQNGNIFNNKATNGNGGGVALAAGTLNISDCDIYGNIATTALTPGTSEFFNEKVRGSGGGIAMKNGSITVTGNSNIHTNQCSKFGAGLYTYKEWTVAPSTDADYNAATFTGGTFHDNGKSTTTPCYSGGGICVEGPVEFSFGANVESNQAYNGGGIALGAYAKMTYTGGHIRNNHAIHRPGTVNPTTGYNCRVYEIDGMGGGIFMGHHTELKFASGITNFGIYNNIAEHGADDIFANGLNSSVVLPEVNKMTLDELGLDEGQLFWVEDYVTDDTNYLDGTREMENSGDYPGTKDGAHLYKNWRYRYALNNEGYGFYDVDGGQTLTCYTSLALGYEIIYINIEKKGMKAGDSAMFKIASKNSDNTYKDYMTVLLSYQTDRVPGSEVTDKSGVTTVTLKKRICLIGGYWRVAEVSNWSWAYNLTNTNLDPGTTAITKTMKLSSSSSEDDRTFIFENQYKSGVPKHDEGVKVNQIIPIE